VGVKYFLFLIVISASMQVHSKTFEQDAYDSCKSDFDPVFCELFIAEAKRKGVMALDFLSNHIRPQMMKGYKAYNDKVGKQATRRIVQTYENVKPAIQRQYEITTSYWYDQSPEFFEDLSYAPTPLKMAQEKLLFLFWDSQEKVASLSQNINKNPMLEVATQMLVESSEVRTGKVIPKIMRVKMVFGEPIYMTGDPTNLQLLRDLTDSLMRKIQEMSGQEYVDIYATRRKAELNDAEE